MFAQMKSRKRHSRPCPCQGTCRCHAPKESIFPLLIPIFFPLIFPILIPGSFILIVGLAPLPVHHVQFSGRDCILRPMVDNCTSTGACTSHDEIVCPKE